MAIQAPPEVRTRRFTSDEVWQMVDAGIIDGNERLELIDGEICLVSPSGWDHALVVEELGNRLMRLYGLDDYIVRMQSTVGGSEFYLPEPDIAARPLQGPWRNERRHPRVDEMLLVIEVSATSQYLDRRKVRLYAQAGTPVYWIVDIPSRSVTVHQGPRPDGAWDHVTQVAESGELTVPGIDARIAVKDIFPAKK
jgi:Uma2 family endonuclease